MVEKLSHREMRPKGKSGSSGVTVSHGRPAPFQGAPTLDACGVDITWTVLGLTPLAFGRL